MTFPNEIANEYKTFPKGVKTEPFKISFVGLFILTGLTKITSANKILTKK